MKVEHDDIIQVTDRDGRTKFITIDEIGDFFRVKDLFVRTDDLKNQLVEVSDKVAKANYKPEKAEKLKPEKAEKLKPEKAELTPEPEPITEAKPEINPR
jgi:succinate dehydrogenase/fumarate reductase-like Fe-S protein